MYTILIDNFERYYPTKVPFMINIDINFLKLDTTGNFLKGLNIFLDDISSLDDVYVLSIHQVLAWMKTPKRTGEADFLAAWGCQSHLIDKCSVTGMEQDNLATKNTTNKEEHKNTIQKLFPDGNVMVFWQTAILVVLYLVIWQYDKLTSKNK